MHSPRLTFATTLHVSPHSWLTDHQLSCEQAVDVLQLLFGLGDVAIQALVAMHPRLTDPENIESVIIPRGFQYDDERADAREALKQ